MEIDNYEHIPQDDGPLAQASNGATDESNKVFLLSGPDDDGENDTNVSWKGVPDQGPISTLTISNKKTTLLYPILSPSPFPHHNDPATADRYRSALQRIITSPQSDVEAWQALMNECMTLYRTRILPVMEAERNSYRLMLMQSLQMPSNTTPVMSSLTMEWSQSLENELGWAESCHGHLLYYFPYTAQYYVSVVEMLLARSALLFESLSGGENSEDDFKLLYNSPLYQQHYDSYTDHQKMNLSMLMNDRQEICEAKIEEILHFALGIVRNQKYSPPPSTVKDSNKSTNTPDAVTTSNDGPGNVLSYDATDLLGGMCTSSIELWLLYIRKRTRDVKRMALTQHMADSSYPLTSLSFSSAGEELIRNSVSDAYETALSNGAAFTFNNHLIWRQYINYVKSWSSNDIDHALLQKQRQVLRSIYQRLVAIPMTGLDSFWTEYELFEKSQSEQLASVLIAEHMPKYQHARSIYLERNRLVNLHELHIGRLATPPVDMETTKKGDTDATNPPSTSGTTTLTGVKVPSTIEGIFGLNHEESISKVKDECAIIAKWQRRCAYERTNPERLSAVSLTEHVRLVYKEFICSFMRHAEVWHEWSSWELLHTGGKISSLTIGGAISKKKNRNVLFSLAVLELAQNYLPDSTLLAYSQANIYEAIYSNGKIGHLSDQETSNFDHPAIKVMAKFCDRHACTLGYVLLQRLVRKYKGINAARAVFADARRALLIRPEDYYDKRKDVGADNEHRVNDGAVKLVIHRGNVQPINGSSNIHHMGPVRKNALSREPVKGIITWHLYASHASIEHRLNKSPSIAARVLELGLKKHRTFLSTPQYVMQYADILLELNDEANLRALLTKAVATCEEDLNSEGDSILPASSKRESLRRIWDMMLKFESVLSTLSDYSACQSVEARRRKALYGQSQEDIFGSDLNMSGAEGETAVSMQRSIVETLIRLEGYDVCSRISNGMHRLVESLEVSGIWNERSMMLSSPSYSLGVIFKDDESGGISDASFIRRMRFKEHYRNVAVLSYQSDVTAVGGGASGKFLSAKERLAHSTAQNPTTLQAAPEWLRALIMLLPFNARALRVAKAPPHLIEITLAALRDSSLPIDRPHTDENITLTSNNTMTTNAKKRIFLDGTGEIDSSDDDHESSYTGGYGDQFRTRQRARLMGLNSSIDTGFGEPIDILET